MRILAFDSASDCAVAALVVGDQMVTEARFEGKAGHGEQLLPLIEEVLERASVHVRDVELLAVGLGPGTFTGVRLAIATAKGFAIAYPIPVVGVSTLEALAVAAAGERPASERPAATAAHSEWLGVLTNAYRGEVYAALYEVVSTARVTACLAPFHAEPAAALQRVFDEHAARLAAVGQGAQPLRLLGDGLVTYREQLDPVLASMHAHPGTVTLLAAHVNRPSATALALRARAVFDQTGPSDLDALEPLYVRGSDAQLPKTPLATLPGA